MTIEKKLEKIRRKLSNPLKDKVLPAVRVTEKEYLWVHQKAEEEGMTITDYIRACILSEEFL